jgi:Sap, sulfolipid-1-addressing protein
METVLLLALAAAIYPQLLAVVVVILTRPSPRPLLWACYLGSIIVSVGAGIAIFAVFRSRGTIAGTSSHRLGPATYVTVGAIALVLAWLLATRRGRGLLGRDLPLVRKRAPQRDRQGSAAVARVKSRAEGALREGSLVVAGIVGALLGVPGPFDVLALGHLARTGDGTVAVAALIAAFTAIKFVLIEVPIVSYAIDRDGTAARVERFSSWMQANKLTVVAAIVSVVGVVLIGRGISNLG